MTQAAILAASGSPGTTQGFKNRVINGDMRIDQRNAGASLTLNGTSNQYGIDRFYFNSSQASKLTAQQSTTVPAGFYNSYAITVASAASIGSGDYFTMNQVIEANNTTDLNFGTASAKTVTLSFWVRSSVTGTFVVALLNAALSRSYLATYTISAANTWQQISIPIAGDTSGTWVQGGNTGGVQVRFDFGSGSSGMGTANAWQAGNLWSVSGSASSTFAAQSGATFYITGLQLEVGNTATNFDFRSYGTELQLCQRYCQTPNDGNQQGIGFVNGGQAYYNWFPNLNTPLRTTPSVSYSTTLNPSNYAANLSTVTSVNSVSYSASTYSSGIVISFSLNSTPSAQPCGLNSNGGKIFLTAEL